jgi:predicted DNA binding CopG/RHH family protein
MKQSYDFTNSKPNPYVKQLKKQITIKIDPVAIDYFKKQAQIAKIPYQNLINLYLTDCVIHERKLKITWAS